MTDRSPISPALEISGAQRRGTRRKLATGLWCSTLTSRTDDRLKRSFDVIGSAGLLLVFLPVFLLICLTLIAQGGPVLFSHRRIGRDGRSFGCLKFRTMSQNGDELLRQHLALSPTAQAEWAASQKLKCDPRVTPIGRVLRKTSIDELPQLLNVLRGDMSLVGPRPIVQAETHHYGERLADYSRVRPGLTGLWQISGRSDVTYAQRVTLDCEYVQSRNFLRDITILCLTLPAVLKSRGSY